LDESSFNFGLSFEESEALQRLAVMSDSISRLDNNAMDLGFLGDIGEEEEDEEEDDNDGELGRVFLGGDAPQNPGLRSERSMPTLSDVTPTLRRVEPQRSSTRFVQCGSDDDESDDDMEQSVMDQSMASTINSMAWVGRPIVTVANGDKPEVQPVVNPEPEKPLNLFPKQSRPGIGNRRNTCDTLFVGTTMSDPDKDATIKVSIKEWKSSLCSTCSKLTSKHHPTCRL
jgi:hypothetical protein